MWSQLLTSEPPPSDHVEEDPLHGTGDPGMESLDYEVVESVAYREDQVLYCICYLLDVSAFSALFSALVGSSLWHKYKFDCTVISVLICK